MILERNKLDETQEAALKEIEDAYRELFNSIIHVVTTLEGDRYFIDDDYFSNALNNLEVSSMWMRKTIEWLNRYDVITLKRKDHEKATNVTVSDNPLTGDESTSTKLN